ncbi:MAG: hypothetical protein MUC60_12055 [Oscillatoria sp. Prado101]|nr:hypothetical protein [Oscillatoria sp. Prado101]
MANIPSLLKTVPNDLYPVMLGLFLATAVLPAESPTPPVPARAAYYTASRQ